MLEILFPNAMKVSDLEKKVENLEEENKNLSRSHEERVYGLERDLERKTEDFELRKKRVDEDANRRIDLAEQKQTRAENRLEEVKEECEDKIARVTKEAEDSAKLKAEKDSLKEIRAVESELSNALSVANAEAARADESQKVVEQLKKMLEDNVEFVKFALTKLPDVDLTNFNINVDVPPAEVTIKNETQQGGKKK